MILQEQGKNDGSKEDRRLRQGLWASPNSSQSPYPPTKLHVLSLLKLKQNHTYKNTQPYTRNIFVGRDHAAYPRVWLLQWRKLIFLSPQLTVANSFLVWLGLLSIFLSLSWNFSGLNPVHFQIKLLWMISEKAAWALLKFFCCETLFELSRLLSYPRTGMSLLSTSLPEYFILSFKKKPCFLFYCY